MSVILNKLANYDGGLVPNVTQHDDTAEPATSGCHPKKKHKNKGGKAKVHYCSTTMYYSSNNYVVVVAPPICHWLMAQYLSLQHL